jgi:hypothetical protein
LPRTRRIFLLPSLPSLLLARLAVALMLAVFRVRWFPSLRPSQFFLLTFKPALVPAASQTAAAGNNDNTGNNGNGKGNGGNRNNGNGQAANGNGQAANGNGQAANGNGQAVNGNGQAANGNGRNRNNNRRGESGKFLARFINPNAMA